MFGLSFVSSCFVLFIFCPVLKNIKISFVHLDMKIENIYRDQHSACLRKIRPWNALGLPSLLVVSKCEFLGNCYFVFVPRFCITLIGNVSRVS